MRGKIIAFEGVDCSFKETNAKFLYNYLKDNGVKVEYVSFPLYENESSYYIKKLLSSKLDVDDKVKTIIFLLEQADYMQNIGTELLDKGVNIIMDRYFTSNYYYYPALLFKNSSIDFDKYFFKDEYNLEVPRVKDCYYVFAKDIIKMFDSLEPPDVVVKMINHFSIIEKLLKEKESVDDYERDTGLIKRAKAFFDNFHDYGAGLVFDLVTYRGEENPKSKSEKEIEEEIKIIAKASKLMEV